MHPVGALLVALAVAAVGWLARALTGRGAVAAAAVGTVIVSSTGVAGLLALGAFFFGSSLVSRLTPDLALNHFDAKGSRRDALQVLANGGAAAVGGLVELGAPGAGIWMVGAALAAAAADTWATSIGALSPTSPRHIVTGQAVPTGTSGGVSLWGTAGGLAGGAVVAAALLAGGGTWGLAGWSLGLGFAGMLLDSVLGGTVQGRFVCDTCRSATERRRHRCGSSTRLTAGWGWLDNDGVNAAATLSAALVGLAVWSWQR